MLTYGVGLAWLKVLIVVECLCPSLSEQLLTGRLHWRIFFKTSYDYEDKPFERAFKWFYKEWSRNILKHPYKYNILIETLCEIVFDTGKKILLKKKIHIKGYLLYVWLVKSESVTMMCKYEDHLNMKHSLCNSQSMSLSLIKCKKRKI